MNDKSCSIPVEPSKDDCAEVLAEEIIPIVEDHDLSSKEKAQHIVQKIEFRQEMFFSGPLPHPALLKQYNEQIPNGAERMMRLVENQAEHRMKMEGIAIPEMQKQSRFGQVFAFVLCLLIVIVSVLFLWKEQYVLAGMLMTFTLVLIATLFIRGKERMGKDIEEKE